MEEREEKDWEGKSRRVETAWLIYYSCLEIIAPLSVPPAALDSTWGKWRVEPFLGHVSDYSFFATREISTP